jgi:hypothetical protein
MVLNWSVGDSTHSRRRWRKYTHTHIQHAAQLHVVFFDSQVVAVDADSEGFVCGCKRLFCLDV